MTLVPIYWDTLITMGDNSFENGLNDEWEIRLTLENKGPIEANNITISELIPEGTAFVPGSLIINGITASPITDNPLTFELSDMPISSKIEVQYKIKAVSDNLPIGICSTEIKMAGPRDEIIVQTAGELYVK